MALEGLHHITAITADAPGNVDFYTRVLGLRLVKKTVNFDAPDVYHLYYGDELGTPGSILTFFEFPGAVAGRAGDGMVHRILWRVGSAQSLAFWSERLAAEGVEVLAGEGTLRFADPEGLDHELRISAAPDAPLIATAADVPAEHALRGFDGVRAYASRPQADAPVLQALGFTEPGGSGSWLLAGAERRATYAYDEPPAASAVPGAGTIHHVAWSAADDSELAQYGELAAGAGAHPTPIIDRQYFHSVYFRQAGGVLFELASRDIGFTADEPADSLGRALKLPARHEHLRERLERSLTPLPVP